MPIDKTSQVNASVVLEIKTYEWLKELAKRNRRSVSKQVAFWIDEKFAEDIARQDVRDRYNAPELEK